jgi:hypothetical protein
MKAGPAAIVLSVCLLLHALWAALEPITAADLWWTMAAGRWIAAHGTVPAVDVFSYTFAGAPWFNQEWLSQVAFYELYRVAGGTALAVLKIGVVVTTFALAAWIAERRSGSFPIAIAASCAAAYLCRPFLDVRPQIVTFLGTLVVLGVLHAYRRGGSRWILALVPLTVALWTNLHSGFIYGVGMCFLFAGAETLKTMADLPDQPLPAHALLPLVGVAMLVPFAALLNPQGLHALVFPFTILAEQRAWREVIEWSPPVLFGSGPYSPSAFTYYLLAQLGLLALVVRVAARGLDVSDTLLFATTAAMALASRRFIPLFALVSTPFMARNFSLVLGRFAGTVRPTRVATAIGVLIVLATAPIGWRIGLDLGRSSTLGLFNDLARVAYFPKGGAEFLKMNPLPARLFNLYSWSGYVMFELPEQPVFIDGRAHMVYPGEFWHESIGVEMGRPGWEGVLDKYEVSVVLWASTAFADGGFKVLLDALTASPVWVRVYTEHDVVFAHAERGKPWIDAYESLALAYPDLPYAQLFAGEHLVQSGAFDRAYEHFVAALARHASLGEVLRQHVLVGLEERAEATSDPGAWFQVAFLHDVLGDRADAQNLYGKVAAIGIAEPMRSYVTRSLARLAS